ncbi:hypothetical protein B0H13DRAFT_2574912 [Mycena leptocephala]|nr:hypothetical protein B0H13DRAFT_2574912 [Mycena leptocephala]
MDPVSPHPHSVDLLRNRTLTVPLGPFDGTVGAFAQIGARHYFITTNTNYVPALPSITVPHAVFLRSDMRYGTDDPTLWPQQWTAEYPHMPLISMKGSRPELDVMWWDPSPADFTVGSAVTRGLGRLTLKQFNRLLPPINELVARCKALRRTSPALAIPLFGELIQHIAMWLEQLQTLPTTYSKMLFGLTSLQRAFLELDALYNYMTVYQARMNNYMAPTSTHTSAAEFVGAFTTVPFVAQQLWAAKVPFWLLRPVEVFDAENILDVVPLREPEFDLPDADAHGAGAPPVLYSGNSTLQKIAAIKRASVHTPWYHDPFETTDTRARSPSPDAATPVASSSRSPVQPRSSVLVASGSPPVARNRPQQSRPKPYSAKPPTLKGPAKTERDKFSALTIPEMPPSIVSMADALAQVDRSVNPYTSNDADKRYVLPEPALLVNTTSEHAATPTAFASAGMEGHLGGPSDEVRPSLEACNLSSVEGFPVPVESLPEFGLEQTREIVWQVAETSFRFEFCALDKRASKRDRLGEVKDCFAGHMLVGVPLEMSKRGWASTTLQERHRYVGRTATLMLDWTTKSTRPNILRHVAEHRQWSPADMEALETAVCRYYTQAFWEYFGRAAVVPLRLDHELEKEEGEL